MRAISPLAGRQDGVISRAQLRRIGLTKHEIDCLIAWGYLLPLHRGVYAVGHRRLEPRAHLRAALLALGPTAFLSHRTAAAVWGLRNLTTRLIELTVPGCRRRSRGSLVIHHTADGTFVTARDGLRVSSVSRLLIELASRESAQELDRMITLAIRKRILNLDKMQDALAGQSRRRGLANLRTALANYMPRPDRKSDLERAFDELLAQHPEIPPPQRNIHLHGWEIDCYWPEQRLAVELDGRPYHLAVKDIERDRLKDAKLLTAGIRVLRITDNRFEYDARDAVEDLLAALGVDASSPN
jgi:Protein of unknown function (DUF559)